MSARPDPPSWWRTVTGTVLTVPVAFVCAWILVTHLPPAPDFMHTLVSGGALLALGCVWLVLAGMQAFRYRWDRRILIAPLITLVTAVFLAFGVPGIVGWRMSVDELTAHAEDCTDSTTEQRIGVYPVMRVEARSGGCLFYLDGGFLNTAGLAYLPDGLEALAPSAREHTVGWQPVDEHWYGFVVPF